ncbi:ATP-binding protein [Streptomyces sp. TRM70308]|uniref:ATP-binding protein n=1 Tax=Streptomyces TaxID=1883 RepID=UPI00224989B2|nr:ATP-binding protein [Streptomyces sp. JHD 1]MCX2970464.1 ATP-binding protein [Streptomyces sp. JHD 1]
MITAEHQQPPTETEWAAPDRALCTLPVTPAAAPVLRRFARTTAQRWSLSEDVHDALGVVVTELVTNVILHSGSPHVTLWLQLAEDVLRVEVRDGGRWQLCPAPHRDPDAEYAECGRGLALVEAHAARTAVRLGPEGTTMVADLAL